MHRDDHPIAHPVRSLLPPVITGRSQSLIQLSNDLKTFVDTNEQFRRHYILWTLLKNPNIHLRDIERDMSMFSFGIKRTAISDLIQAMHISSSYSTKIQHMTPQHSQYRVDWTRSINDSELLNIPWLYTKKYVNKHSLDRFLRANTISFNHIGNRFRTLVGQPIKFEGVWAVSS
jgi:hypothetical protein